MLFDQETLEMLFDELGLDLNEWITDSGYTADWTDQQIYAALPQAIKDILSEVGIHASWMHDGM